MMTEPDEAVTNEIQLPVLEFEGQPIDKLYVQLPGAKLEVDQAFARNTFLTLKVEYRVRNIQMVEDRKGVFSRNAVLVLDGDAVIVSVDTAEERLSRAVENGDAYYPDEAGGTADSDARPDADRETGDVEDWEYERGEGGDEPTAFTSELPASAEVSGASAEIIDQSIEEIFV